MNKIAFFLLTFFACATMSFAQETYIKSSKTWKISKSKRIVMTPFVVKSDKAVLRWNARTLGNNSSKKSKCKNCSGGYSVYISTTGNSPKNFTDKPILTVSAENSTWTRHSVNLSRYEGKKIWVAFVNSANGTTLYLNEFYAGVPSCTYLLAEIQK